jgi:hypothetical protein
MHMRKWTREWRRIGGALTLAIGLVGCGAAPRPPLAQPVADSTAMASGGISQSAGTSQSSSQSSGGGGISQSSEINQSSGGTGSSSMSSSRQVVDNGDGTVTIIETRQHDGQSETTRRTVKRSELDQGSTNQTIEQRIEQK